jgi:hypothetical protein
MCGYVVYTERRALVFNTLLRIRNIMDLNLNSVF